MAGSLKKIFQALAAGEILLLLYSPLSAMEVRLAVRDSLSREPVANAWVVCESDGSGAFTDEQGRAAFSFLQKFSGLDFTISRIDYDTLRLRIPFPQGDTTLHIRLRPHPLPLSAVTVEEYRQRQLPLGEFAWSPEGWKQNPLIINDPLRLLQSHPSTAAVTDYNSLFYVRGGTPDQNLFYLDNVPISNPYRLRLALGGGFSILSQHQVETVEFYPGVFSAFYGGQFASVVSISAREGDKNAHHLRLDVNPFEGELQFEGPLGKHLRMNTALRRGVAGDLLKRFYKDNAIHPEFADFQGNLSFSGGKNQQFKLGWLAGDENSLIDYQSTSEHGKAGALRTEEHSALRLLYLNHKIFFNARISLESIAAYKRDDNFLAHQFLPSNPLEIPQSSLIDTKQKYLQFRQLLAYESREFRFRSGYGLQWGNSRVNTDAGFLQYSLLGDLARTDTVFSGESFMEVDWQIAPRWQSELGLRMDYFSFYEQSPRFSPRGSVKFQLFPSFYLFGRAGLFYQFPYIESMIYRMPVVNIYRYRNGFGLAKSIKPEKQTKIEAGGLWKIPGRISLHASLYYRYCGNAMESYYRIWSDVVTENSGKFRSRGAEVWADWHPFPRRPGFNVYFSGAVHHSEQFYRGSWFPAYGSARGDFLLRVSLPLGARFFLSSQATWLAGLATLKSSGIILTDPSLPGSSYNVYLYNVDDDNSYFRWDLRLGVRFSSRFSMYLDFINLTNRRNLFSRNYLIEETASTIELKELTVYNFPFLGFFGLQWKIL